jgi:hypothetical protein
MHKLETLLDTIDYSQLPPDWTSHDLTTFSQAKVLWDYQQDTLYNAVKALWRYYAYPGDVATATRKQQLYRWYGEHDLDLAPINLGRTSLARLLSDYYPLDKGCISYEHFVNRIGFWMATGSGKTLVIVKLIEMLRTLMVRHLIPQNDVLVLTHREDLLEQLRTHVGEFNSAESGVRILLRDLKEFPAVKREYPSLLSRGEITVFTYRSDNLSDEQKERIIDFRNYDNGGRWYVLLDEAHKGDKNDSKRQHIYSIMSRNGFLFNFSATFTDPRDILTTAAEFNLASFILRGYGKSIAILKQENRAFKHNEDYSDDEKQRIVLQSLLMLALAALKRQELTGKASQLKTDAGFEGNLYHRPLLLTLVNSVNTEDADLKIFFNQLDRIARGVISDGALSRAARDLMDELVERPRLLFEGVQLDANAFLSLRGLTISDLLRLVFNAQSHGAIEVLSRPSNNKELAFKLKSSDAPFALIRIGNTADWLKSFLTGYEIVQGFQDESFFERLNRDDSSINLLMGSRSFYEGWDSNRPNVITFINIGVGEDSKKFILQSIGRGIRLEPVRGRRKRLKVLASSDRGMEAVYSLTKDVIPPLETLAIFGTNRQILESVLNELDQGRGTYDETQLDLPLNPAIAGHPLLIPTYHQAEKPVSADDGSLKFELSKRSQTALTSYINHLGENKAKLLFAYYDVQPHQIVYIIKCTEKPGQYFNTIDGQDYNNIEALIRKLAAHADLHRQELSGLKELDDEIAHFRNIQVDVQEIDALRRKIAVVQGSQNLEVQEKVLASRFEAKQMTLSDYTTAIKALARTPDEETFAPFGRTALKIKNIASHYYIPVLLSESEHIDYIDHVIKVVSEISFIKDLERYLAQPNNLFGNLDWWFFSWMVQQVDRVTIPYFDRFQNRIRDFHPDFIFWLKHRQNGSDTPDYTILFVDPKGTSQSSYQHKIDGYEDLFLNQHTRRPKIIPFNGMNVQVRLTMYSSEANLVPRKYRPYWCDHPNELLPWVFS